jgi:peroxiredoxin
MSFGFICKKDEKKLAEGAAEVRVRELMVVSMPTNFNVARTVAGDNAH